MKYHLTNWYVIQTFVNKEKNIKEKIEGLKIKDLQTLLPLRKLCIKRKGKFTWEFKPLFQGYFFINKKIISGDIKKITGLNGVVKILHNSKDPASIPEEEMKLILSLIDKEDNIQESRVFYENDKVIIKTGPLMNMEGNIVSVDKHRKRITVRLPFFNQFKDVQFSFEIIEKV